jgi:hypothetical protein
MSYLCHNCKQYPRQCDHSVGRSMNRKQKKRVQQLVLRDVPRPFAEAAVRKVFRGPYE